MNVYVIDWENGTKVKKENRKNNLRWEHNRWFFCSFFFKYFLCSVCQPLNEHRTNDENGAFFDNNSEYFALNHINTQRRLPTTHDVVDILCFCLLSHKYWKCFEFHFIMRKIEYIFYIQYIVYKNNFCTLWTKDCQTKAEKEKKKEKTQPSLSLLCHHNG